MNTTTETIKKSVIMVGYAYANTANRYSVVHLYNSQVVNIVSILSTGERS